ncbi:hypothetical protein L484_027565 [Morus notabilis]|uniref:Uncharacterized protein n=1 Tax=Morus notabilis TaxID=981085 RepID=W9RYE7_9ROSA|nr:hypothetical protein L484_027565 [Morus notabilis]
MRCLLPVALVTATGQKKRLIRIAIVCAHIGNFRVLRSMKRRRDGGGDGQARCGRWSLQLCSGCWLWPLAIWGGMYCG